MQLDRRQVIAGAAGMAALSVPSSGWGQAATPAPRLFAGTPLAANPMARHFERVDMALPNVPVMTVDGPGRLSGVGGKTRLLALWAEWCVPCLAEIRDFAKLRPGVATDRFDMGLLLTGSAAKLDYAQAVAKLTPLGAATMPLLVEPNGQKVAGDKLASATRVSPDGAKTTSMSLPCTLLLDSRGRVKGRAFGAPMMMSGPRPQLTAEQQAALKRGEPVLLSKRTLTQADKDRMMANGKTSWAGPAAEQFLKALGDGMLDRI